MHKEVDILTWVVVRLDQARCDLRQANVKNLDETAKTLYDQCLQETLKAYETSLQLVSIQ